MSLFGIEIDPRHVAILPDGVSKHDVLDQLVDAMADSGVVSDREVFRKAVFEREAVNSTGIGDGIAIPHVRLEEVTEAAVGVAVSEQGVDFDTLDNKPVHLVVMFATPAGANKVYLGLLAKVMVAIKKPGLLEKLLACETAQDVANALNA